MLNNTVKILQTPRRLVLDYKLWVCGLGRDYNNKKNNCLGKGQAKLLNKEGFMCCLGQFCKQAGIKDEELLDLVTPRDCYVRYGIDIQGALGDEESRGAHSFVTTCIDINDDDQTTIAQKAIALKEICDKHGIRLTFKNFPKKVSDAVKRHFKGRRNRV